jgi:hypothetical protein
MLASANERDYNIDILNCKEKNYKKLKPAADRRRP